MRVDQTAMKPVIEMSSYRKKSRACNICGKSFFAQNAFNCFCKSCKERSDLYKFSEWLPDSSFDSFEEVESQRIDAA